MVLQEAVIWLPVARAVIELSDGIRQTDSNYL